MSDLEFTHLDPMGRARMVDVTPKEPTHRRAVARCKVFMLPGTTAAIANREVKKGDVIGHVIGRQDTVIRAVVPQSLIDDVRDRLRSVSVMLDGERMP